MTQIDLATANRLVEQALALGAQARTAPLTVAVLDAGGHLLALQRQDGSSPLRPQIALGKAHGAIALGKGSRALANDAQQRPAFIGAANALAGGYLVPVPGGVLVRSGEGTVIGAVGISGDTSDVDERCAVGAIEAVGLRPDAG